MGASRKATSSPIKYPDNGPDELSGMEVTETFEKRAHALLSQPRMACEQAPTWGIGRRHKIELKRFNVSIFFAKLSTIAYITKQSVIPESGITRRRHAKNVHRLPFFLSFFLAPIPRCPVRPARQFFFSPYTPMGAQTPNLSANLPRNDPCTGPEKLSRPLNDSQPGLIPKLTPKRIGVRAIFCQGRGGGGGGRMRVIQCTNIDPHMK